MRYDNLVEIKKHHICGVDKKRTAIKAGSLQNRRSDQLS
mgnify:FL=1|jgi:hypothetical protein